MSDETKSSKTAAAEKEQPIALTADLLKTLITEIRKPVVSEEDQKKKEQEKAHREMNAEAVRSEIEERKWRKKTCTHKHREGKSHCVFIQSSGYILCQKCQVKIRAEVAPVDYKGEDIYNLNLFNEIMQSLGSGDE